MVIGASFQHSPGSVRRRPGLRRVLAFAVVFVLAAGSKAQQSHPVQSTARPPSKSASPFLEAETLLRQGSIAEAKVKIEEQLRLNPSSVEGYNLLGIVYSSEKDYDNALEAFQHALKLDPNSARTHNNLGNVYVAQEKFDLAREESSEKSCALILATARPTTISAWS